MRTFGSVQTCFWENGTTQQLSDQAKLLALYLLTGPHSNMIGCFRLPNGYVTEDLKWECKTVTSAFLELEAIQFAIREEQSGWVLIHDFLKINPIQNPKQGICIEKQFHLIPRDSAIYQLLVSSLLSYGKYLSEGFVNRLLTLSGKSLTDKNKEQDKDNNQNKDNIFMSGTPDVEYSNHFISDYQHQSSLLNSQAIEVLEFLNQKTGKTYRPVDSNLKLIIARLKSNATVMDCRQVIAKKKRDWESDPKMSEYLRPATLFNAIKFEQYMGELVVPKEEMENGNN